jgi:hypothetical protein
MAVVCRGIFAMGMIGAWDINRVLFREKTAINEITYSRNEAGPITRTTW